jgi:uncharacterized beta-barrel protein YwiB (DUF1934 family)
MSVSNTKETDMTKDVLLSITGLQFAPNQESDTLEMIAPGEYYFRNGKHYFLYDEVTEGFDQVTKNVIKVAPDYMELTKKGVTNVHMIFEKNRKNVTYYYTPFGSLLIGIDAKKVDVSESPDSMCVEVDYGLELNYEHLANCHITIDAKPKGTGEFHLMQ